MGMVHNLCRIWLCWFSMQFLEAPYPLFTHCVQPPPQALRFSHRRGEHKTQVTGDEPQGTMGRVQTVGEALPRPDISWRERDVWTRQHCVYDQIPPHFIFSQPWTKSTTSPSSASVDNILLDASYSVSFNTVIVKYSEPKKV